VRYSQLLLSACLTLVSHNCCCCCCLLIFYSALVGVWSIVINPYVCLSVCLYVCLSVCLSACLSVCKHIAGTAGTICTKFCVPIPCRRGSVLLWQHCTTLCTSGFMDDITFGRNGHDTESWRLTRAATAMHDVWSLMSLNACYESSHSTVVSMMDSQLGSCSD